MGSIALCLKHPKTPGKVVLLAVITSKMVKVYYSSNLPYKYTHVTHFQLQWCPMVWDKIPMIWDIIDLANYSLDWHDDLTKSEHHGNSNVADTKN